MKELYDKVIAAYQSGDENAFNAAARNWVEGAPNVHFDDPEVNDLFSAAKRHCALWRNNAISGRVSKLRMIECVRKIAAKNLPNPYVEKKHVFGVIPSLVPTSVPAIYEGEEVEPKEKKHIFGKRRKGK